jgi:acyl dehydratase
LPIPYPDVLALKSEGLRFAWSERDAMLYALGLGFGADPLDEQELRFVYEEGLQTVPTLATAVAFAPGPVAQIPLNAAMVVHADQRAVFHRPFPAQGELVCDMAVTGAWDRGPKGAMLEIESRLKDASGRPLATLTAALIARGDGGFGGSSQGAPELHPTPDRDPDVTLDFETRPEQALLYRLSGDRNPLHADPKVAEAAGFERPILHGLCTYGVCCRAVLKAYAGYDPTTIRAHDARFSAPVFPGETVSVDLWRDGDVVSFQARVKARDITVVRHGRTLLG